ncbi:outer membrane beta-barrel protein [Flaviaesturariibacter amylovorans]|uniref:TonB-dependent receptor n=1 Tax=Flaviaesturariibacter amylovorans TaxID=1084520 RepID=A0ABP8GU45_9BACT
MRNIQLCLLTVFLISLSSPLLAQGRLSGSVRDTAGKQNLEHAVVTILHKKDSTLATFTRTDKNGAFQTKPLPAGKYVLLLTFPKFADLSDEVDLGAEDKDLQQLSLTPKSLLLKEVIVKANTAIRVKGDTTEFAADSFAVKEGATVEDLLKRLPGFSVNAKGEVTTQGKRVDKVLVDGEEFFGDDPTMATQNLSAKIVKSVQVYDTKTEQQNLTSINSGNEGKTLNIKLKEDSKKGGFGKLSAGTDFTNYLEARGLYNRFVGKKKFSVYGTRSNVNTGSLNWQDKQKLGMENDMEYDEISGYYYSFGSDDGFNDWSLRGLPDSYTGGALFSNKWNNDRQNLNGSYRYNQLGVTNKSLSTTQNIFRDTTTTRFKDARTTALSMQHALNGKYEFKLDSLTTLTYKIAGTYKTSEQRTQTYSHFLRTVSGNVNSLDTLNTSDQDRINNTSRRQIDQSLVWKQLFKKKNRMLITTLRYGMTDDDQRGTIKTAQAFYESNVVDSVAVVDQMRNIDGRSRTIGVKSTFNEPLSEKLNFVLEYGYNQNNSESYRNTFNKSSNGKYESLDTVFSSNFDLKVRAHNGNATLRYMYKKLRFAVGTGLSQVQLNLHDLFTQKINTYTFRNITPQAQFGYMPKPQMNINFSYRGTTRQPTIDQLQPIRDNNDPLNVFEGNPNLKVGFVHGFNLGYNRYKALKGSWVGANFGYNITQNAITMQNQLNLRTGKQTYRPVNVNGNRDWYLWSSWSVGNGEKKWSKGIQVNGNGGRTNNFLNGLPNTNTYMSMRVGPSVGYSWTDHVNFHVNPEIGYNNSRSSLQADGSVRYFTFGGNFNASVNLPGKIEVGVDGNIEVREKVDAFAGTPDNYLINASISRKVFKNNSGKIMLTVNDLLNQNVGFSRNINSNFINEERYSRIARYFMLRFEWSFTKAPGSK